jgi:hypothetical protein
MRFDALADHCCFEQFMITAFLLVNYVFFTN